MAFWLFEPRVERGNLENLKVRGAPFCLPGCGNLGRTDSSCLLLVSPQVLSSDLASVSPHNGQSLALQDTHSGCVSLALEGCDRCGLVGLTLSGLFAGLPFLLGTLGAHTEPVLHHQF